MTEEYAHPKRLFHYTSLKTLALILSSRQIRFSRLDRCNDPLEGRALDFDQSARTIFVSCWTAISTEAIPLWRMYTGDMAGVRIEAPLALFSVDGLIEHPQYGRHQSFSPEIELGNKRTGVVKIGSIFGPQKILYTEDKDKLTPKCKSTTTSAGIVYDFHFLGMTKRSVWSYEDEWRFRILAAGARMHLDQSNPDDLMKLLRIVSKAEFLFVPICDAAIEQLSITLGPKSGQAECLIVQSLVEKYCPSAEIRQSTIAVEGDR